MSYADGRPIGGRALTERWAEQDRAAADNSFAKPVAIAPSEPLAPPPFNPHCGVEGCTRGVYHDHASAPESSSYGTSPFSAEQLREFDRQFRDRVVRWAGSQGCPEGVVVAAWLERQQIATPQFVDGAASTIQKLSTESLERELLLRRALPMLADLAGEHPEIAKLCADIKAEVVS